jgi:hypothetical protein
MKRALLTAFVFGALAMQEVNRLALLVQIQC